MPEVYALGIGAQLPVRAVRGATAGTALDLVSDYTVVWESDHTTDSYPVATARIQDLTATGNPSAAAVFDSAQDVYLLIAYKGSGGNSPPGLYFVKEADEASIDGDLVTKIGAGTYHWHRICRIVGTQVYAIPPGVSAASTLVLDPAATPAEGDMLVYKSGKWELLDPQGPGTVLMSSGVSTAPDYQTIATVLAYLLSHNGSLLVCNPTPAELTLPGTAPPSGKYWGLCSTTGTSVPQWVPVSP